MKIYNKPGSKERLLEMFEGVTGEKITINENISEATDTDKYENVVFVQGEEADEPLRILNDEGEEAALEYLKQWHDFGNHEGTDQLGAGSSDSTFEKDGYIMSYNPRIGYIGLQYDLKHGEDEPYSGVNYSDAFEKYGFNDMHLNEVEESFDNPEAKDEKYLDKGTQQEEQPNKYDDGVRYPVEEPIKTDDPSLEGLKGDDAPLDEENIFSKMKRGAIDFAKSMKDTISPDSYSSTRSVSGPMVGGSQAGVAMAQKEKEEMEKEEGEEQPEESYMATMGAAAPHTEGEEMDVDMGVDLYTEPKIDDKLEGGLADEETDLGEYDIEQLLKGLKVEFEHTDDPMIALEIAMDHLQEDPEYYGEDDEDPEEKAKEGAQDDAEGGEEEIEEPEMEDEKEEEVEDNGEEEKEEDKTFNFESYTPKKVGDVLK